MKVYLGKSNRSNPNIVNAVRAWLNNRFTVLEYQGGTYSDKDLRQADAVAIVLENNNLGKGIFEQILVSKQLKKKGYVVFPYKSSDGFSRMYICSFDNVSLQKVGDNDYVNWGKLTWNNSATNFPITLPIVDSLLNETGKRLRNLLHNDLECYNKTKTLDEVANITKAEKKLTNKFVNADGEPVDIESVNEDSEKKFQEFKHQCLLLLPRLM